MCIRDSVRIADLPVIDRAGDGTGGAARNAACVLGIVIGVRINRAPVDAGFDGPLIAPCNAAGVGHTRDLSLIFTLPQPVSYTHLDVYKRQRPWRRPAR